ncbi:MAG: GTPase Era [Erysipelotrichaceae bacterium]|jgi:GTP-binding protein Era|nr:GTPase Era [Erysipelotrichaceae bacterium]HPY79476.1 GTPase Era [Bacilli bacterium]HQA55544.1 GTPase Era [Bacilli bacterium]
MMKVGFVSILGRPNVGKSTILNGLLNQKVSIVTDKSQTTRNNIRGIYNSEEAQVIFVDTPGVHKPRQVLGQRMNTMAYSTAHDVDVNMLIVDASQHFGTGDEYLLEHLDIKKTPLIIVFNKIDQARLPHVNELKEKYLSYLPEAHIVETVATEKFNLDDLLKKVLSLLPKGMPFYPTEVVTDKDEIFQIKEIIREKTLKILKEEVPHSIAVYMENIEWEKNPMPIKANIIVEKDSQKGIVIGANGKRIKLIGTRARQDIETLLKKHVYLELQVRVEKDWRSNEKALETFGYKLEK